MSTDTHGAGPEARAGARLRLGTCPDSWGVWFADDPRQTPWTRFLDEVAKALRNLRGVGIGTEEE